MILCFVGVRTITFCKDCRTCSELWWNAVPQLRYLIYLTLDTLQYYH